MNSNRMWCSKADIMQDLAKVTGRFDDVDEDCIAFGRKPPPVHRIEKDDNELEYIYGTKDITDNNNGETAPDLNGIMQMLKLVNDFDNEDLEDPPKPGEHEILTISKLNPNVPEYVPKKATTSLKATVDTLEVRKKSNESGNKSSNSESQDGNTTPNSSNSDQILTPNSENKKDSNIHIDHNIGKRIDVTKLKPDEIMDSIEMFKSKISKDKGCRRQKNVAIATLLKLYSAAPNSSQSVSSTSTQSTNVIRATLPETEHQPVLFTPEYFETRYANGTPMKTSSEQGIERSDTAQSSSLKTDTEHLVTILNASTSSSVGKSSTESSENISVEEMKNDPEVRESIKKVNRWLDKPTISKPKAATVFLKPISFRKKENSNSLNVLSSGSSISTKQHKKQTTEYRPSKYAEDLSKKFTEQSKCLEKKQLDMWTRVQNELREKEEKIKQDKSEK